MTTHTVWKDPPWQENFWTASWQLFIWRMLCDRVKATRVIQDWHGGSWEEERS